MVSAGNVGAMGNVFDVFSICFGVSTLLMRLKTRLENRKLEEGLARMREKWEEEADEQRRS